MKKILFPLLLICILLSGCTQKEPVSKSGILFDTIITVTLYDSSDTALLEDCFKLASHYDSLLSRTLEESEIYQLNHSNGDPVLLSDETLYILKEAIHYAQISGGLADPSIGSLSVLWDFGSSPQFPPSTEEIAEALTHVNYENILIDGSSVRLTDPDTMIDLGFIAKGYIADKMKEYLVSQGVQKAIINLGGNVLTIGSKPDGSAFTIGIQSPFGASGEYATTVSVTDRSVVSSGTYERFFEHEGVLYHHILSTLDGYPVRNELSSVTILSESSLTGDALSTTCFALGYEKGMEFIQSMDGIDAIFITTNGNIFTTY